IREGGTGAGVEGLDGVASGRQRRGGEGRLARSIQRTGLPTSVPSISNCTVPCGIDVEPGALVTVAVKVTGWGKFDGLTDEVTVVEVATALTVTVMLAVSNRLLLLPRWVAPVCLTPTSRLSVPLNEPRGVTVTWLPLTLTVALLAEDPCRIASNV